jgi:hypothetical protein
MPQSKGLRRLPVLVAAMAAALALMAPMAHAAEPAEGYEKFAGCPSPEEYPSVASCTFTTVQGGHFNMGSKEVPIENPITLSGGFGNEGFKANAKGGMSVAKQKVPGGIIGLTGLTWLLEFLGSDALTLYAVTEPAGLPKVSTSALTLPIKVHLINPVLGNNCYIGSNTEPIVLNLTTGTTNPPPPNEPIKGTPGKFTIGPPPGVVRSTGGTFVDNSFAAPGANGCKLVLFGFIPISINGLVNSQSGLPSPAGTNETVQNIDLELVSSKFVYP